MANRIQQVEIIEVQNREPYVIFRDAVDIDFNLDGNTYRPGPGPLEMLRRIIRDSGMIVDFDWTNGIKIVTRRETPGKDVTR